jgi:hypothetical protein
MASSRLTYDTRTGRIISLHHGQVDDAHARRKAQQYTSIGDEHITVITVPLDGFKPSQRYKVDTNRKTLVECAVGDGGVGFSVGSTAASQ